MINALNDNKILGKIKWFIDSKYFPIFIFCLTLLVHVLALDLLGWVLLVVFATFINLFCDDLRPLLPLATFMPFVVSSQNTPGYANDGWVGYYANDAVIVALFVLGVIVVISFILRPIIYKGTFSNIKQSKLILGFLLLVPCYLLAGLFTRYYEINNLILGGIMVACHTVFYFFVYISLKPREDNFEYLANVMVLGGILIALEIAFVYLIKYEVGTALTGAWKNEIIIGSIPSNPAGGYIAFTLPYFFYLAYKNKHGYIFYVLATLCLLGVFFTLSRGALLISVPIYLMGTVFSLVFSKDKKPLIITVVVSVLAISSALLSLYFAGVFEKVFDFYIESNVSDNGRFKLWKDYFEIFKKYPIFGGGFSAYMLDNEIEWILISLAHNTLIQILCSAGVVGFLMYAFHRYQTAKLFLTNINLEKVFIAVSILCMIGMGFVDPTYFYPQFALIYSFALCFAERQTTGVNLKNLLKKGN